MVMFLRVFIVVLLSFLATFAHAYQSQVVEAQKSNVQLVVSHYLPDGTIKAGLVYTIEPGWKIYWQEPGDTGYPVQIDLDKLDNASQAKIMWPFPKRYVEQYDTLINESYTYQDKAIIPFDIKVKNNQQKVSGSIAIDYGICREICIPAQAQLPLVLEVGYVDNDVATLLDGVYAKLPKANGTNGLTIKRANWVAEQDTLIVDVVSSSALDENITDVFVRSQHPASFYKPDMASHNDGYQFTFPVQFLADAQEVRSGDITVTFTDGTSAVEKRFETGQIGLVQTQEIAIDTLGYTVWLMLLFALLGGLILNVMPCVLPVLSIKVLSVVHASEANLSNVRQGFFYASLGIVCSFLIIALLVIILQHLGHQVGWGLHFQEPLFIVFLTLVMTFFGASLIGVFNINIPFCVSSAQSDIDQGEITPVGHFLTGMLATLLATPCTAPFLGAAVGFALAQGALVTLLMFAVMGVGMALPYLLVAIVPKTVAYMPKPGKWMVSLKNFLGFLMFASALFFIWVLSGQLGSNSALSLLVLQVIFILLLSLLDEMSEFVKWLIIMGTIVLSFMVPVQLTQQAASKTGQATKGEVVSWQAFKPELINEHVASGKVVFIDITADWCLTCKVNKLFVLDSDEVSAALNKTHVISMRADWTNYNADIAAYLKTQGRAGIPFNAVFGPSARDGIILSELLTQKAVLGALQKAENNP